VWRGFLRGIPPCLHPLTGPQCSGSPGGVEGQPSSDQSNNKPTNMDDTSINQAAKQESMWLLQEVTSGHVLKRPIV
jgi:hypothetical protein